MSETPSTLTGAHPPAPTTPTIFELEGLGPAQLLGDDGDGWSRVLLSYTNTTTRVENKLLRHKITARLSFTPGGRVQVAKGKYVRPQRVVTPAAGKARFQRHVEGWANGADFDYNRDDLEWDSTGPVGSAHANSPDAEVQEPNGNPRSCLPRPFNPQPVKPLSKHRLSEMSRKQRQAYRLALLYGQGMALDAIRKELSITRRELNELRAYAQRIEPGALQRPPKDQGRDEQKRFVKEEVLAV